MEAKDVGFVEYSYGLFADLLGHEEEVEVAKLDPLYYFNETKATAAEG